jgi:hypothetical protein
MTGAHRSAALIGVAAAVGTMVAVAHGCAAFRAADDGGDGGAPVVACIPQSITGDAGAPDASCGEAGVVDLSSSTGHCGTCNHSCANEGCETGQCRVSDIVTVGFITNNPPAVGALRNGTLYFAQADTVYQAPGAGGAAAPVLKASAVSASSLSAPFIARDRGWTLADQKALVSFALDGSGQSQVEATGSIGAIATDGTAVYWANADNGQVRVVGNDVPIFADANVQSVYAMATDEHGLYLMVMPKAAGASAKLLLRDPSGQAVRELLADLVRPIQLLIEGGHLYWSDTGGGIWRMDQAALQKAPVTQVDPARPFIKGFVVDAQSVFMVSSEDGNGGSVQSSFHAASKCGGPARLLRSDSFWGGALVADTDHLYWSHPTGVARMPK